MFNKEFKTLLSTPGTVRFALLVAILVLILPYTGLFGSQTDQASSDDINVPELESALPLPEDFDAVLERGEGDEIIDEGREDDGTNY